MEFLAIAGALAPDLAPTGALQLLYASPRLVVYGDKWTTVSVHGELLIIGEFAETGVTSDHNPMSPDPLVSFTRNHWGSYVALRLMADEPSLEIATDPSGMLPCYYLLDGDVLTFGSNPVHIYASNGTPVEIDWQQVALQLLRRDWRGSRCALRGLGEVPAGCGVSFERDQRTTRMIWSPRVFLDRHRADPIDDLGRALRLTIQSVVTKQFAHAGKILVGVSGGLDSSIVCACLAAANVDFECFTMYAEGSDADERGFARMVAQHFGVRLAERPYSLSAVDLEISSIPNLARPIGWPFQQALDGACVELADLTKANAVARGTGGDAVFCYNNSATPIADALLRAEPFEALRAVFNVSRVTGASIWQAGTAASSRLRPSRRRPAFRLDPSFLVAHSWPDEGTHARHPWLDACQDALPGQQRHVDMLCSSLNFVEARLALPLHICCPLFSQPVFEMVLGTPSTLWVSGGINRAIARQAFADRLPETITRRTTKGGPDSFAAALYRDRRRQIRAILLEGQLAVHGIIDRAAIERMTSDSAERLPPNFDRMLALVDAESWVRNWTDRKSSITNLRSGRRSSETRNRA